MILCKKNIFNLGMEAIFIEKKMKKIKIASLVNFELIILCSTSLLGSPFRLTLEKLFISLNFYDVWSQVSQFSIFFLSEALSEPLGVLNFLLISDSNSSTK